MVGSTAPPTTEATQAPGPARRLDAAGLAAATVAVVLGAIPAVMGRLHGAYFATTWLIFGVFLAAVGIVLATSSSGLSAPPQKLTGRVAVPTVLLGALVMWTLATTVWATDAAAALEEGTRTLLYCVLWLTVVYSLRDRRSIRLCLIALCSSTAVLAVAAVIAPAFSASPDYYFRSIKLNEPVGYYNAQAALLVMPAILAIHLSTQARERTWVRALMAAAAVVMLESAVLTQCRGAFWAGCAAFLSYLILVPHRGRSCLWLALVLGAVVAASPYLNHVHLALRGEAPSDLASALQVSLLVMGLSAAAVAAVVLLLTWVERVFRPSRRLVWGGRALGAGVVITVLVLLLVLVPALTDLIGLARSAWDEFRADPGNPTNVRILDLSGSYRYQLWTVAWTAFEARPLTGSGAGNYHLDWYQARPLKHDVQQPHNLYLRLLAETGIPGLVLFLAAVAGIIIPAWYRTARGRFPSEPRDQVRERLALLSALTATVVYFLVHASVEWLWNVPACGAAFFLCLGLMTAASRPGGPNPSPRPGMSVRTALLLPCVLLLVLALAQAVSHTLSEHAASLQASDQPATALGATRAAAVLNPLSAYPHTVAARAYARMGDLPAAEGELLAAESLNPRDWTLFLLWGDIRSEARLPAGPWYLQARALNPLSPELAEKVAQPTPTRTP